MRCLPVLLMLASAAHAAEQPAGLIARLGSDRMRAPSGRSLAISPNGAYVAIASNSQLHCFDGLSGQRLDSYRGNIFPSGQTVTNEGDVIFLEINAEGGVSASTYSIPRKMRVRRVALPANDFNRYDISPDGRTLAMIQQTGIVTLYDGETGKPLNRVQLGKTGLLYMMHAAFSADGQHLALGACDGKQTILSVVERKTAATIFSKIISGDLDELALSADGSVLAVSSQSSLAVYSTRSGERLRKVASSGNLQALSVTADGTVSLYEEGMNQLRIYEPKARAPKKIPLSVETADGHFTPDGKRLALLGEDGAVLLYDAATGKMLPQSAELPTNVKDLRYTTQGRLVGYAKGWLGWDNGAAVRIGPASAAGFLGRGGLIGAKGPDFNGLMNWPILSPDGTRLANLSGGKISILDAATGKTLQTQTRKLAIPKGTARIQLSPDVWFTADGRLLSDLFHPDMLYTIEFNGPAKVYSKLAAVPKTTIGPRIPAPDGRLLLSLCEPDETDGRFNGFLLHDCQSGKLRYARPVRGSISEATFTPDGSRLALQTINPGTTDFTTIISIHETARDRCLTSFAVPTADSALAISPDGRTVAMSNFLSADDDELVPQQTVDAILYEAATGRERGRVKGVSMEMVWSIAFAPDGRSLAVAADDGTVGLWDIDRQFRPGNATLESLWKDLLAADAAAGYRAVRGLQAQPDAAVKLFREKLPPMAPADAEAVARNIRLLASPVFAERDGATRDLAAVADRIVPALREAAASTASEEARQRLESLLAGADDQSPESRRGIRAVEVAEALALSGHAEAKKLLQLWAGGAEGPALTREAKAALGRVK